MKKIPLILLLFFIHIGSVTPNKVTETFDFDPIIPFVEFWDDTPYRFGGNTLRGVDCSGLIVNFFKTAYDKKIPRSAYHQYKISKKVNKENLTRGDLVFFRSSGRSSWHVGLYLGGGKFVHSSSYLGVTVSSLYDKTYKRLFRGAGRILFDKN